MNPSFVQPLTQSPLVLGILSALFIWLVIVTFLYWRALRHYRQLTKEVKGVDLKRVLEAYLGRAGENTEEIRRLQESLARIQRDGLTHFQRVGLVRFNPFEDTGGDQSFALALLDNHGSGIVISSLYQRETTRIYGKPVKEGKEAGYEFSDEEEEAIKRAREQ